MPKPGFHQHNLCYDFFYGFVQTKQWSVTQAPTQAVAGNAGRDIQTTCVNDSR